jgi:hypothetical protein
MNEIIFLIEDAPEGGFMARALDVPIFTDADDLDDLHRKVREAVDCHFEPAAKPKIIRLHFVREAGRVGKQLYRLPTRNNSVTQSVGKTACPPYIFNNLLILI